MRRVVSFLVLILLVVACTTASPPTDNLSQDESSNPVETVQPSYTPEPSRTYTPTPTWTITASQTRTQKPSSTPSPSDTTAVCTNRAEFIRHLSVSDNSKIKADYYFAKVWRVKNAGTCTWNQEYSLVFDHGDSMKSPPETPLTREVKPGEMIDLQVALLAPIEPKIYAGYWLLRDPTGQTFGAGDSGKEPFSAIVNVIGYNLGILPKLTDDCSG
jgi:hypothetical protein